MAWGHPNANEDARGPANSCRRRYHAGCDRLEHPILRVGVLLTCSTGKPMKHEVHRLQRVFDGNGREAN
jgi:hypothetical protein